MQEKENKGFEWGHIKQQFEMQVLRRDILKMHGTHRCCMGTDRKQKENKGFEWELIEKQTQGNYSFAWEPIENE